MFQIPAENILKLLSDSEPQLPCPNCGEMIDCYQAQVESNLPIDGGEIEIQCDECETLLTLSVRIITKYDLEPVDLSGYDQI
jgi:hypothetical protein